MELEDIGYNDKLRQLWAGNLSAGFEPGRVVSEHKERYSVKTASGEFDAEVTGNLRFTAMGREDFPAVGDWVALTTYDGGFAIIHKILPRYSIIKRQAAGHAGDIQVIAANIDYALLVQAVDRDFNINRLERYLTICYSSGVSPIIVLTKTDLADKQQVEDITESIRQRVKNTPVAAISSQTGEGYEALKKLIEKGKTYCMLGSSGVGKSTLLNSLSGKAFMKTDAISQSSGKGRHITTHRELIVLESGAILIDNPGMREVGIADAAGGLEATFDRITDLARHCRFKDCTHTVEKGCAVLESVEKGETDRASYENFMKLERERAHFESTIAERRQKEKGFGKILKNYKKDIKKNDL